MDLQDAIIFAIIFTARSDATRRDAREAIPGWKSDGVLCTPDKRRQRSQSYVDHGIDARYGVLYCTCELSTGNSLKVHASLGGVFSPYNLAEELM